MCLFAMVYKKVDRCLSEIWQPWHTFFGNPEKQISDFLETWPCLSRIWGQFFFRVANVIFCSQNVLLVATLSLNTSDLNEKIDIIINVISGNHINCYPKKIFFQWWKNFNIEKIIFFCGNVHNIYVWNW